MGRFMADHKGRFERREATRPALGPNGGPAPLPCRLGIGPQRLAKHKVPKVAKAIKPAAIRHVAARSRRP